MWCGDRRTVVGGEVPVFAGLEFGGFYDLPHMLPINKLASYGFPWNRIGNLWAPYTHHKKSDTSFCDAYIELEQQGVELLP